MSVGKATDPQQAALDWSVLYEGVSLADGQTKESEIKANALKWYTSFDGKNIPSSIKDAVNDGANNNTDNSYQEANSGCDAGSGTGEHITSN